jgi:hypothetical protein
MRQLAMLIAESGLRATCPSELRHAMHARWFENGPPSELLRVFSEIEGRLYDTVELSGGVVLLDKVSSDPIYVCAELDESQRRQFMEHLAEAGVANSEREGHTGVLSPDASWSETSQSICVEAEIVDREDPSAYLAERDLEARLREFLPRVPEINDVFAICAQHPCELIMNPAWGVRAVWVGVLGGDEEKLDFEIGPDFVASVSHLDYIHKPGLAAACLRAMALIAAGRGREVDGHETKKKGSGSETLRVDGHAVMRSRIENRRPDANRLHWIRGPRPKFLNVSGHGGGPSI